MKTTTTIIAALAVAIATFNAQARIGETYDQAFERYGQETEIWTDGEKSIYKFDKGPFRIAAQFDADGKIGEIVYIKRDESGVWTEMTPKEVVQLLQNNKQKGWQSMGELDGDKVWKNGEKLFALYGVIRDMSGTYFPRLHILTKEALDKINKDAEAEENAAQEGL